MQPLAPPQEARTKSEDLFYLFMEMSIFEKNARHFRAKSLCAHKTPLGLNSPLINVIYISISALRLLH